MWKIKLNLILNIIKKSKMLEKFTNNSQIIIDFFKLFHVNEYFNDKSVYYLKIK